MGKKNIKKKVPSGAIIKYILLQIPALVLLTIGMYIIKKLVDIPLWLFWTVITIWALKDLLMFPKVWRAYDSANLTQVDRLIGKNAVVVNVLNPAGYVRIDGELWKAEVKESSAEVSKGKTVKIKSVEGMKLLVEEIDNTDNISNNNRIS